MQIFHTLQALPQLKESGLTIGTFDGVHLGHQHLIRHLRQQMGTHIPLVVLTFSNHPSEILTDRPHTLSICTLAHKFKLLKELSVDVILAIPFTASFAKTPFDDLLTFLKNRLQITHLVLGEGAAFGNNRAGNAPAIQQLATSLHFQLEYLSKLYMNHHVISSGLIRTFISQAKFSDIQKCIGRPYSVYAPLITQKNRHYLDLKGICLPPQATYPVQVCVENHSLPAEACIDTDNERMDIYFQDSTPLSILEHLSTSPLTEVLFDARN